ncbi:MAG TPA: ribonuclease VapC [Candidatus Nanoarchaeia archaeon]|nr:ribonuclease VapC [Candidatus Nanoarchaeia archaeon]
MRIILDTNFLIHSINYKIDIFAEIDRITNNYSLFIVDKTIDELKKLNSQPSKLALKLLEFKKIKIIKTEEKYADDAIVNISDDKTIVATQDKELKQRLKKRNIKLMVIRQKKYYIILA